jgi:hypothetical protein
MSADLQGWLVLGALSLTWLAWLTWQVLSHQAKWHARDASSAESRAVASIYLGMLNNAREAGDLEKQRSIRREAILHGIDLDEAIADALRNEE